MPGFSGSRVVCADGASDWYGHVGTVTNFNRANAGVHYDDDAAPPPTGRWSKKTLLLSLDNIGDDLAAIVARNKETRDLIAKAKESAQLAVHVYNSPTTSFRTGGFLVLMVIAWTAAMLAKFRRDGIEPYYVRNGQVERVDGMPRVWSPEDCVRRTFASDRDPVRKNLEFAIGVRNRVVHAHCPPLDDDLFGECQALMNNFEGWLVQTFDEQRPLGAKLTFALQSSTPRTPDQTRALKRFLGGSVTELLDFVDDFRTRLEDAVFADPRYRFRVLMIPVVGGNDRNADAAVQYVQYDPSNPQATEAIDNVRVLVRDRHREVLGKGKVLPGEVARAVQAAIPWQFSASTHHPRAVKHFGIRGTDPKNPAATDARYCVYSEPHRNYAYTTAWIEKLKTELVDPVRFREVIGLEAKGRRGDR